MQLYIDFQCDKNAKKISFHVEKKCQTIVDTGTYVQQFDIVP